MRFAHTASQAGYLLVNTSRYAMPAPAIAIRGDTLAPYGQNCNDLYHTGIIFA